MRWAWYVARIGEVRNAYKVLVEKLAGIINLEELGVNMKLILECILEKLGGKVWIGCICIRIRTIGRLL